MLNILTNNEEALGMGNFPQYGKFYGHMERSIAVDAIGETNVS